MGVLLLRRVDVVRMHEERGAPWRPVLQTDAGRRGDPPFLGLCLLVHVFMACLSATACGAVASNNENCTATA